MNRYSTEEEKTWWPVTNRKKLNLISNQRKKQMIFVFVPQYITVYPLDCQELVNLRISGYREDMDQYMFIHYWQKQIALGKTMALSCIRISKNLAILLLSRYSRTVVLKLFGHRIPLYS